MEQESSPKIRDDSCFFALLRRGADAHLAKPFVEEEMLVTVANLLEIRRKLQEKYRNAGFGIESAEPEIVETQEPKSVFDFEDVF